MDSKPGGIGLFGALSIGVGGIVGGGFFATFGITAASAAGGTPIAFLIGGVIALLTAYSYIGLTLAFPGPGGTVSFITRAFGSGIVAATVNVLLVLSYIAIMSVYAYALAGYTQGYLPQRRQARGAGDLHRRRLPAAGPRLGPAGDACVGQPDGHRLGRHGGLPRL